VLWCDTHVKPVRSCDSAVLIVGKRVFCMLKVPSADPWMVTGLFRRQTRQPLASFSHIQIRFS
jgi:hypothetical protein